MRSLVCAAPVFSLRDVRSAKGGTVVLNGIDLDIPDRALTALVGPSGAGKTSLLRLLNRLDDATEGEIRFRVRRLEEIPVRELRRRVGFVFQAPVMFPGTVRENLRQAMELGGGPAEDVDTEVRAAMELTGLEWALVERPGEQLSLGQQQRANIARALMTRPDVLLMDEPTSALDAETAERLLATIRRLGTERGLTVVMVTHRLPEARRASDFTVVMEAGRIVDVGPTSEIIERAGETRIRAFLERGE